MSSKTLVHKGYIGSIACSLEDDCLYGQILFINDLVSYEGASLQELRKAFADAVDFYLAKCKEEGLTPDKPCSGSFNVRITPELHREACVRAANKGISLNEFVKEAIAAAVTGDRIVVNQTHNHTHVHTIEVTTSENVFDEPSTIWQRNQASDPQNAH